VQVVLPCIQLSMAFRSVDRLPDHNRGPMSSYLPGNFHLILQQNYSGIVIREFLTLSWTLVIASNMASAWAS
jgi:hypothetical protein